MEYLSDFSHPKPENEPARLQALRDTGILDTPREADFDSLIDMARSLFDMPIILVSLIDEHRQWIKAGCGLDVREVSREYAFCNYTVATGDVLIVENACEDARFSMNPMVIEEPGIRFYAGAPIHMAEGLIAGSVCLIDTKPRKLEPEKIELLTQLARTAAALLRYRGTTQALVTLSSMIDEKQALLDAQADRLSVKKRLLENAFEIAKLGAWEYDIATSTMVWTEGMYALHAVDRSFAPSLEAVRQFYSAKEFNRLTMLFQAAIVDGQPFTYYTKFTTLAGQHRSVYSCAQVEIVDGEARRIFGMMQDVTAKKHIEDRLRTFSERDALTNLYNRFFLLHHLDTICKDKADIAFIMLDLDGFKGINDTYGHAVGDACLKTMARRLRTLQGKDRLVARLGGDEFAIVATGVFELEAIIDLAERIRALIAQPVHWKGQTFLFTSSIGISMRKASQPITKAELMSEADLALYQSKNTGRDCFSMFRPELKKRSDERLAEINGIREALAKNEMELYYQARVPLGSDKIGGFEALLRWNHPDGQVRAPGAFMGALEDPLLSVRIGDFVLRSALDQAATWRKQNIAFGCIAINIGAGQFRDPKLAQRILSELHQRNLPPECFEIEVTEDVMLSGSTETILETCRLLRQNHVGVSFDDFGTGFASLTHLLEFPLSAIKIDQSFISRLSTHAGTTSIVRSICEIGRGLGLHVVAEGVETEGQADFLRAVGCDYAQGYLYHRPSAGADAERFCRQFMTACSSDQMTR